MTITKVLLLEPGLAKIWGAIGGEAIVSQPWIYTRPNKQKCCLSCGALLQKGRTAYRPIGGRDWRRRRACVTCIERHESAESGEGGGI